MSFVDESMSKWFDKNIDDIFNNYLYECQMNIDAYLGDHLDVKKLINPINVEFSENMNKDNDNYERHNKQRLEKTIKVIKDNFYKLS